MQRERVSENVYWFQSEVYAQVTAGVITGSNGLLLLIRLPCRKKHRRCGIMLKKSCLFRFGMLLIRIIMLIIAGEIPIS